MLAPVGKDVLLDVFVEGFFHLVQVLKMVPPLLRARANRILHRGGEGCMRRTLQHLCYFINLFLLITSCERTAPAHSCAVERTALEGTLSKQPSCFGLLRYVNRQGLSGT